MMTLEEFFSQHPKAALAFSGGTDSAYLLYAASQCKADILPILVKSPFLPLFELDDAKELAQTLGVPLKIAETDPLKDDNIRTNPADRCFWCKKQIFSTIAKAAAEEGYTVLLDGTNASDDVHDRPGMKVLSEMQVLSPLRLCGLTKPQIRKLSKQAGLFTWNKPAYACLATRIPAGQAILETDLEKTERAEKALALMGFSDFRIRLLDGLARIQVCPDQFELVLKKRHKIEEVLKDDYAGVLLDLKERRGDG